MFQVTDPDIFLPGEHEPEEFWEEFLDLLGANAANFPISSYAEEMDIKNSHDFIMIRIAESSLRERLKTTF